MPDTETLIRLFEQSRERGHCKGCYAPIDWFETLNKKHMPMTRGAVPRKSETDPETGHVIGFFAAAESHWTTCPARGQFSRRRGSR